MVSSLPGRFPVSSIQKPTDGIQQVKGRPKGERGEVMTVNVLLSGRLKLDGYGQHHPANGDGTLRLGLGDGSTVSEVIRDMAVPSSQVAMTMINGRKCRIEEKLKSGDRVILIPPDVAALWRFLGNHNLGAESVFDF